jgi:3'-phosphoadenosine 5'-phosphosulfate sulfotransferase (PAPS reductase)/FAD synthetase
MTLIEDARRIFNAAYDTHKPTAVFILTSGGNDSVVPLHLFASDDRVDATVHIDTGIRAPEVEPHVVAVAERFNIPLLIYRASENTKADGTPDPQRYEDFVMKHGFPGPAQHTRMYNRLKQRAVERLVREHRGPRGTCVMLVTGVRKAESRRRMGYVEEEQRLGGQLWVAPVANWDNSAMSLYRAHHEIPKNPVSEKLGMSGECLCGAFAKPGELDEIAKYYPEVAQRLRDLQARAGLPWGYGERPDRQWREVEAGQGTLGLTPLCTSCVARGRRT